MDIVFHYPPELLNLLVDAVPLLCRSKEDVLLFFRGAGVGDPFTADLAARVRADRSGIKKYEIVRTVLTRLNANGEGTLRERREILKRVTEFENFSSCWPEEALKAKGLVSEIRSVVGVKDSFTRMSLEREKEAAERTSRKRAELRRIEERRERLAAIKRDLAALFAEKDAWRRGRALEGVLNRLCAAHEILVREAFTLRGDAGIGIAEQIDGVVELDGHLYLVEMKWHADPLGTAEVAQHLVRVYGRGQARGLFISASGYTDAAIATCKDALHRTVVALLTLQEVVLLLEREGDLKDFLKYRVTGAIVDKDPMIAVPS
jgi:restriction system protein